MLKSFVAPESPKPHLPTEVRAGIATWLTMVYIVFVNPAILSQAGMPAEGVAVATALSAAIGSILMGFLAKYPLAQAPGMGLNAFFAFTVVLGMGISWQTALAAVLVEGVLFLILSLLGIRTRIMNAIPGGLKLAASAGIGLFLALIGLSHAGIIIDDPATLVRLGAINSASSLIFWLGLFVGAAILSRGHSGGIITGILVALVGSWMIGTADLPTRFVGLPDLTDKVIWAFDFQEVFTWKLVPVVLTFLFVDLFDTAGTLYGVGSLGGLLDAKGELPRAKQAFVADSLATIVGAILGTSTVTTYIESAAGIKEGGKTGITALVVGMLFFLTIFLTPLVATIPLSVTAPALVLIGATMMGALKQIRWDRIDEALPTFLTVAMMPLAYSIAAGLSFGIISYAVIRIFSGRGRETSPLLYALALVLVVYYGTLRG